MVWEVDWSDPASLLSCWGAQSGAGHGHGQERVPLAPLHPWLWELVLACTFLCHHWKVPNWQHLHVSPQCTLLTSKEGTEIEEIQVG